MIKYIGSKRLLIPHILKIAETVKPATAVDMFTGTTRVAQALKSRGISVSANDLASYSKVFSECYISTDAAMVDHSEIFKILHYLNSLPGLSGYVTTTFCQEARFFHPKNGERIDAIRETLNNEFFDHPYFPILLTSLIEAADKVDSTTGVQMAYLKEWAPRALKPLELKIPELINGSGYTYNEDANSLVTLLPNTDFMYLDPPYNQHRYFSNYHIWETIVRWDYPETYGIARKRIDAKDENMKSSYNAKREMPIAFRRLVENVDAKTTVISYNNESWISAEEISSWLEDKYDSVLCLEFEHKRYVGAQIGIHNPQGVRVGKVGALRNTEYLIVGSDRGIISDLRLSFS